MVLTPYQTDFLLLKIKERIGLPLLGDKAEKKFFERVIERILEKLVDVYPLHQLEFIHSDLIGLTYRNKKELEEAIDLAVSKMKNEISLTLLSKEKEEEVFFIVIELILKAMQKNHKL